MIVFASSDMFWYNDEKRDVRTHIITATKCNRDFVWDSIWAIKRKQFFKKKTAIIKERWAQVTSQQKGQCTIPHILATEFQNVQRNNKTITSKRVFSVSAYINYIISTRFFILSFNDIVFKNNRLDRK